MERIVVGLSGGVDSFVTALMLQRKGFRVVGVNLVLWKEKRNIALVDLCNRIGIELLSYDGRILFREKVVEPFVKDYLSGHTPSPCVTCNSEVKWKLLAEAADSLGIEKIATGHYVRKVLNRGSYHIRKGKDETKDQSYYLWGLKPSILFRIMTPLGDYTKEEVKTIAVAAGYESLARKQESMGICFLERRDYREFVVEYSGGQTLTSGGDITDVAGNVIGKHTGVWNYTVGQKKEMLAYGGKSMYVAHIDVAGNRIIADIKENLFRHSILVKEVNMLNSSDLSAEDVEVKVRGVGLNPQGVAKLTPIGENKLFVRLSSPAWAVAYGQPVAFYRGEILLGGGIVWNGDDY